MREVIERLPCADVDVVNLFDAGSLERGTHTCWQVEGKTTIGRTAFDRWPKPSNDAVEVVATELIARRVDARSERGADRTAALRAKPIDRGLDHTGEQPWPAGVHGSGRGVGREHERGAVGSEHGQREAGNRGHDGVGFGRGGRRRAVSNDNATAMHLAQPPPRGWCRETEAIGETLAILDDGVGSVAS